MALARLFPIDATYAQDSDTAIGRRAFPRPKSPEPKHPQTPQKASPKAMGPSPGIAQNPD